MVEEIPTPPGTVEVAAVIETSKKSGKGKTSKQEVPPVAANSKTTRRKYRSAKYPLHHPYQKVRIPTSGVVELEADNWVKCQVAAKVIVDLGEA